MCTTVLVGDLGGRSKQEAIVLLTQTLAAPAQNEKQCGAVFSVQCPGRCSVVLREDCGGYCGPAGAGPALWTTATPVYPWTWPFLLLSQLSGGFASTYMQSFSACTPE